MTYSTEEIDLIYKFKAEGLTYSSRTEFGRYPNDS